MIWNVLCWLVVAAMVTASAWGKNKYYGYTWRMAYIHELELLVSILAVVVVLKALKPYLATWQHWTLLFLLSIILGVTSDRVVWWLDKVLPGRKPPPVLV